MKRLNMVNLPLQEEIYDKNGILSIRRYNYGYRNASDTSLVVVKSIESYDQTSERWETVSHFDYDSLGNLVEATDPDGVSTVYIWGHGGLHLVAAVGNATIEQVEKAGAPLPTTTGRPPTGPLPLSRPTAAWLYSPDDRLSQ